MIKVMFVCLGNICRSPMAEAIFRNLVKERGLAHRIKVDSAGTGNWHVGEPPHNGTLNLLKEKGIDSSNLFAREFKSVDFDDYDYLVAMDAQNVQDMIQKKTSSKEVRVTKLLDECPTIQQSEVPDPWYTGDFEETYSLVSAGTTALLDRIIKENHLEEEMVKDEPAQD